MGLCLQESKWKSKVFSLVKKMGEHGSWFAGKQKEVIKVFSLVKTRRTWVLVCKRAKGSHKSFLSCKNMGEHRSWFARKQKEVVKVFSLVKKRENMGLGLQESKKEVIKNFSLVKNRRTWVLVCRKAKGSYKGFLSCKNWQPP